MFEFVFVLINVAGSYDKFNLNFLRVYEGVWRDGFLKFVSSVEIY